MPRFINHFGMLFLVFGAAATLAAAQDARVIGRIEFEGLQQITADEALATTELKTERPFKVEEVDAAAQRLLDSGLFKEVGYRTRSAGNKVTITFQVEEAKGGDAPVVFDNFIWFTDDQLYDSVRRAVPSFTGRAPNVGTMPEESRVPPATLNEQKIPAKWNTSRTKAWAAGFWDMCSALTVSRCRFALFIFLVRRTSPKRSWLALPKRNLLPPTTREISFACLRI